MSRQTDSRWDRGQKNLLSEKVTSSSVARTEWKNPISRDEKRIAHADIGIKGLGFKMGVKWRF